MLIKKATKGFSMAEVMVVAVIMAFIGTIMTNVMINTQKNNRFLEATNLLKVQDQEALNKIGQRINASKMFIGRLPDPSKHQIGEEYVEKIDLPDSFKLANFSFVPLEESSRILPEINSKNTFSPVNNKANIEAANSSVEEFDPSVVGNTLFVASFEDSAVVDTWKGKDPLDVSGTGPKIDKERKLDLIQFNYYYLSKVYGKGISGKTDGSGHHGLALIRWSSQLYVDYSQLQTLVEDFESDGLSKSEINSRLGSLTPLENTNIKIAGAWDYNSKEAGEARIYKLEVDNSKNIVAIGNGSYKLEMNKQERVIRNSGFYNGLTYGIAFNSSKITTKDENGEESQVDKKLSLTNNLLNSRLVPAYAEKSDSDDGFPHGFEVMVSGYTGSRKIFIRMMTTAVSGERSIYNESIVIYQGRDS